MGVRHNDDNMMRSKIINQQVWILKHNIEKAKSMPTCYFFKFIDKLSFFFLLNFGRLLANFGFRVLSRFCTCLAQQEEVCINLIIKASTIDGRRKGACIFCQEYFMDLYLLAGGHMPRHLN